MKKLKMTLGAVLLIVVSFAGGRFFGPTKVEVREVEKIVYRETTKTQTDVKKVVDKKETLLPDGTKVTEIKTTTERSTDKVSDSHFHSEQESSRISETRPDWRVGLGYLSTIDIKKSQQYLITVERRIVSEINVGLILTTEKQAGLTVSIGF